MTMMMGQTSALRNWNHATTLSLTDPDIDWSVFENADRYLLRDDSAWITRLSKDFWWNLERISEMTTTTTSKANPAQFIPPIKSYSPQVSSTNNSARKIVGQRSTIIRPHMNIIPEKFNSNEDTEYDPFQSKISFDTNLWSASFQQAIPWQ